MVRSAQLLGPLQRDQPTFPAPAHRTLRVPPQPRALALASDLRSSLAVHLLDPGRLLAADDPSTSPYTANALLPMSAAQRGAAAPGREKPQNVGGRGGAFSSGRRRRPAPAGEGAGAAGGHESRASVAAAGQTGGSPADACRGVWVVYGRIGHGRPAGGQSITRRAHVIQGWPPYEPRCCDGIRRCRRGIAI